MKIYFEFNIFPKLKRLHFLTSRRKYSIVSFFTMYFCENFQTCHNLTALTLSYDYLVMGLSFGYIKFLIMGNHQISQINLESCFLKTNDQIER
jgi:hypothetical protein